VCTGFWWNIVDKCEAAVNGYFVVKMKMLMLLSEVIESGLSGEYINMTLPKSP